MRPPPQVRGSQAGVTILEVMIAAVILIIVSVGLLSVFSFSVGQNKSQGEVGTRTTEYAQDKMEQLLALSYTDTTSNTTTYPTCNTGSTCGGTGLSDGGGTNSSSPVTGYVDYLDSLGKPLGTTSTGAFYTRVWQICSSNSIPPCPAGTVTNLKIVTVVVTAASTAGASGSAPKATLVSFKSNQ